MISYIPEKSCPNIHGHVVIEAKKMGCGAEGVQWGSLNQGEMLTP